MGSQPTPDDFDESVLRSLYDVTGPSSDFVCSVAKLYREQAEAFASSAPTASAESIVQLAHRLAGSSSAVGLRNMSRESLELETAAAKGTVADDQLERILARLPAVVTRLERWTASLSDH